MPYPHQRPHTPPRPLVTTIAVAALTVASLAGCSRSPEPDAAPRPTPGPTESEGPQAPATPAPAQPDATAATKSSVVARVGERDISADEVAAVVELLVREGKATAEPKTVRAVLDKMIADAVVAEEARAEGFADAAIAKQTADAALAALYLDQKTRAEAEAAVTDEDVERYWGPRRRVTKLVTATRDEASQLQQRILAAIAAAPERTREVFSDFRAKAPLTKDDADRGASTAFDRDGLGRVGEPITHRMVAGAAFALGVAGKVSPPVQLGPNRWALVQLLEVGEGIAPEALTPEQKIEARRALVAARAAQARAALAARLRDDAEVRIDDARVAELVTSLTRVNSHHRGRSAIDLRRLRNGRLKTLPSRLPAGVRHLKDLRKGTPEGDRHRAPPRRRPINRRPPPPVNEQGETP